MNNKQYRKDYFNIINNAKKEKRIENTHIYEKHHILPKSLFPLWSKRLSNLVLLTKEEHIECHRLAMYIWPVSKMMYTFHMMRNKSNNITNNDLKYIRESISKKMSEIRKGMIFSKNHRLNLSKAQQNTTQTTIEKVNRWKSLKEFYKNRPKYKYIKPEKTSSTAKAVIHIETGIIYRSSMEAGGLLGFNRKKISDVCKGINKDYLGQHFKYFYKEN